MTRDVDVRDPRLNRATEERRSELERRAATLTGLSGGLQVTVERVDPLTGNPAVIRVRSPTAALQQASPVQQALQFVQAVRDVLGLAPAQPAEFEPPPSELRTSSGAAAVHLQQNYKGIPIFQATQVVRFAPDGALTEAVGSTVTVASDTPATPTIRVEEAVLRAAQHVARPASDEMNQQDSYGQRLPAPSVDLLWFTPRVIKMFPGQPTQPTVLERGPFAQEISASLVWFALGSEVRLSWEVLLVMPGGSGQYRVLVDALTGALLYALNLIQQVAAAGSVYVLNGASGRNLVQFPMPYEAYGLTLPPELHGARPADWVLQDDTNGLCVIAHLGEDLSQVLRGSRRNGQVVFEPPDPNGNEQLVLNMFYLNSMMHDFFYLLGFREADGNFGRQLPGRPNQTAASDPVDARAHAGAVWGTANFVTPADGQNPVMNMGLVEATARHTAFDASVVIHEYTHGVSNRLVGGPLDTRALEMPQSRGMGEGWGDYFACLVTGQPIVAAWVTGMLNGIRGFRYDQFPAETENFGRLGTGRYIGDPPHPIGEIWCATLLEMTRRLQESFGNAAGTQVALQLVVDAMKLSRSNPGFLDMRDAILTALDNQAAGQRLAQNTAAAARPAIWQAFARFGMGPGARSNGGFMSGIVADFTIPPALVDEAQTGEAVHMESNTVLAIADNDPTGISSTININAPGVVRSLTVNVNIAHSYIGDLQVALVAPSGRFVVLHDRAGNDQVNLRATYRPADTPGLSSLLGEPIQGTWTLGIRDLAAKDRGQLLNWALDLDPGLPASGLARGVTGGGTPAISGPALGGAAGSERWYGFTSGAPAVGGHG